MGAPTYSWNTITSAQTDYKSPLNEVLMEAIRQNQIHLQECLYDPAIHTPSKGHAHTGADGNRIFFGDLDRTAGVHFFEDFVADSTPLTVTGTINRITSGGGSGVIEIKPGVIRSVDFAPFKIHANSVLTFEARVKVPATGNSSSGHALGLMDTNTPASPNNGIFFGYGSSASNWWIRTANATVVTSLDTGEAQDAGVWKILKIVATPTSVSFYIDGVEVSGSPIATNIPVDKTLGILINNGSSGTWQFDWIHVLQTVRG